MLDEQEQRHIYYDRDLKIEAYNLSGIAQKFPNHFHEFYVIGFVYGGKRHLWCKGCEYDLTVGDLIIFNPLDNHFCSPISDEILDYRALNIPSNVMLNLLKQITGTNSFTYFSKNVIHNSNITKYVSNLYNTIIFQSSKQDKENAFFKLLDSLLQENLISHKGKSNSSSCEVIKNLCNYIELNYANNISLDDLLTMTHFKKSYLIRLFTKQVGVAPYRYLQSVRIGKAKKYLEQGIPPIETAYMTGFSDQSHFSNYFKDFIGLTPKQYQKIFTDTLNSRIITQENSNE